MTAVAEPTTLIVTRHRHRLITGQVVTVRGKYRCSLCGHRLTINGVPPKQTRSMPITKWVPELIDRKLAKAQHENPEKGLRAPVKAG